MVKLRTAAYIIKYSENLYVSWLIYVVSLRFLMKDKCPFDNWQMRDIFAIFKYKVICLNRARGASKTRDMALLSVFFALRDNEIKWFAPSTTQLNQAKKYWNSNPFVKEFNWRSKQVAFIILITGVSFDVAITTVGHMKGGRANIVFFDEMALMNSSMMGDILPVTNGMDSVGDGVFLIFFSTPLINTVFEEYTGMYTTLIHSWKEPSWFKISNMRRIHSTISPSKWKTEYECIFAAMDGQVFELNLVNEPYKGELRSTQYYGSDPNPREGYAVVGCRYSQNLKEKHVNVTFAKNFGPNNAGKNLMFTFLAKELNQTNVEAELEDNGVGKVVWDDFDQEYPDIENYNRIDWGVSGKGDKVARVNEMNKWVIHIWYDNPGLSPLEKKNMKKLWSQMNAVQWTKDGTKIDKPSDKPWHLSDSLIHACMFGDYGGAMEAYAY